VNAHGSLACGFKVLLTRQVVRFRQGEGVEHAAHLALQGGIDHLVLLHAALALESLGDDGGGIVIAIAGEVADLDAKRRGAPP
jgi:hypothetical protein